MKAIVFFCFRPPKEIFDFAKLLKNNEYDIFVSINDNKYIIPEYDKKSINVIRLDDLIVKQSGYFNSNWFIKDKVSSRDKAFYYFNKINHTDYKHIWFIEEDVFIPTPTTLSNIDHKYPEGDYMSNSYFIIDNDINNLNNFNNINNNCPFHEFNNDYTFFEGDIFKQNNLKQYFNFPWLKGMSCAIRVTKNFLNLIDKFAIKNKTLIMDEILYPTLALHNKLLIINPIELSPIVWRCKPTIGNYIEGYLYWNYNDINENYLFHPIKDLKIQNELRIKHKYISLPLPHVRKNMSKLIFY
jgi:hypothetical protein